MRVFSYYLKLAAHSLRRNPALTAWMVLAIGVGIGAQMTIFATYRALGNDPIPWKAQHLFFPAIDSYGPAAHPGSTEPPGAWNYTDATAMMNLHAAKHQALLYPVRLSVIPEDTKQNPSVAAGHAVSAEFFGIVDAPFRDGAGWSADEDALHAPVVVIGSRLNDKLFGKDSGVGKDLNLDGTRFRIVGVLKEWNPQPRFYDLIGSDGQAFGEPESIFVPFNWAIDHQFKFGFYCPSPPAGWDAFLHSTCGGIQMLVELPTPASVELYRRTLDVYAAEQEKLGRYTWAPNNRLRNLPDWFAYMHVVPDEVRLLLAVAFGFLLVCLVNVVALMLAKFIRRSPEIGVRRVLGASRKAICAQFLIEAATIGIAGGLLGLVLTVLGQRCALLIFPSSIDQLKTLDPWMIGITLGLSLLCTVAAGFYPTIRAVGVQPAWQLKSN
jgi:putative ABC transport system permease protein